DPQTTACTNGWRPGIEGPDTSHARGFLLCAATATGHRPTAGIVRAPGRSCDPGERGSNQLLIKHPKLDGRPSDGPTSASCFTGSERGPSNPASPIQIGPRTHDDI